MLSRPVLESGCWSGRAWAAVVLVSCACSAAGQAVVLHLKAGDRISGVVLAEDAQSLTLSNAWAAALTVPLEAIAYRGAPPTAPEEPPVATAIEPPPAGAAAAKPLAPKRWKANVNFGLDAIVGSGESQNYFGSAALTYSVPYRQTPERFFRASANVSGSYGEADGVVSADQVLGSLKTDFDLGQNFYAYNLGGAGYDSERRIDLQWEVGPGLGWRAVKRPKLALDLETGGQYLARNLSVGTDTRDVFLRFAENLTWDLGPRIALKQHFAYLPQSTDFADFRLRFDATVSFGILHNLSLNFSVVNLYDSDPAQSVEPNQLQFRSTLGVNF